MYNQNSDLMKQEKFMLPTMIEGDFSAEELAEDADGLQMSFQRVKIPAGGTLQFEMPSDDPDNPDYEKNLVGVILHNHATCAYWPAGSEYDRYHAALFFCGWQGWHRHSRRRLCCLRDEPLWFCT